jgi:hypothetical protein
VQFGQPLVNTATASENISTAAKIRKQKKAGDPYPITEITSQTEEYLFYQISYSNELRGRDLTKMVNELPYPYEERNMVIFLCHGFKACAADMLIIQRGIKQALPHAQIFLSFAN